MSETIVVRKSSARRVRFVHVPTEPNQQAGVSRSQTPPARRLDAKHRSSSDDWLPLETTVAQTDATRLETEYRRGYEDGRKASVEEMRTRLEEQERSSQQRLDALLTNIQMQFQSFMSRLEVDALRFAIAVAERIVRREVALDDELVIRQIQDAVRRVVGTDTVKLRIHPDDELVVRAHRGNLLALSNFIHEVVIESDSTLERGGCIIESPAGNVDARLATQLRQIESALFSGLPHNEERER